MNMPKRSVLLGLAVCLLSLSGCTGPASTEVSLEANTEPESAAAQSEAASEPPQTEQILTGKVYDAAMNTLIVEDEAGQRYSFEKDPDKLEAPDGVLIGAAVSVTYSGVLGADGDTSGAQVLKIVVSPLPGLFEDELPRAQELAEGLTAEEKLRQILLSATGNGDPVQQVAEEQPGGYVLFRRDFEGLDAEAVREKLLSMQEASRLPLIMAVDEEGGSVVRISSNPQLRAERFPAPDELYSQGLEAVAADGREKAELLLSLGCNVLLAPVADVSLDEGDYIHDRTVGLPAGDTAAYVSAVVQSVQQAGCGAVLKHFPGYGNNLNTHTNVSIDERPYDAFVSGDFLPFQAGIDSGSGGVLVSHNIVISMDADLPASLSPRVHQILREELGFTGVIMTDDLNMDAVNLYTGDEHPAVLAVAAGNDLLLTQDFPATLSALEEGYAAGRITDEMLDAAVERVLCWKLWLGLFA